MIKKAIILAGGLGERLRPLTLETPKPLLLIKGKPILDWTIENLKKYGITDIVLLIGYKADRIKEHFGDGSKFGVNITYFVEKERLGTGGGAKIVTKDFDEPFLMLNGDNMADFNYDKMLELHKKNNAKVTIALYPVEDVTQFGIAELKGDEIVRFIEKPTKEEAPSNLNNAGAYIIEPHALDMMPDGKCSIERDCFEKIAGNKTVFAYRHDGQWFPTDNMERYNKANKEWKENVR
ncbi:MAG: nucleotidyltransferase family protein [Nanoarchaeota archaeon]|nr:nucleotidyltransferase family protein [Nanoarchaeota archaeon]